jgi:hypothetical protein
LRKKGEFFLKIKHCFFAVVIAVSLDFRVPSRFNHKKFLLAALLTMGFTGFLCQTTYVSQAWAAAKAPTTINFNDGSCQIYALDTDPPFAPGFMEENEKAFALHLKYKMKKGFTGDILDALDVLREKGQFIAPDGKIYKTGPAAQDEEHSIYWLISAVPENLDVGTLKFRYEKTTTESLKVEIDRVSAK